MHIATAASRPVTRRPAIALALALGVLGAGVLSPGTALAADATAPSVTAPTATPLAGSVVTAAGVAFKVVLGASDGGSGLVRTRLQVSVDGGSWTPVTLASATARSAVVRLLPPHDARFRANATDGAGNTSAWKAGVPFRVRRLPQDAAGVTTTGTWSELASSAYLNGTAVRSSQAGATLSYAFTGAKVAWIGRQSASGGSAAVYLDGAYVRTVSTHTSTRRDRVVLFAATWGRSDRHTLELRVVGTAGHPNVTVDGFVLVDPPGDPVLVGAGDIARCGASGDDATAKLIAGIPGRVFAAGDLAYPDATTAQFRDCYDPSWGAFKARTSPVPGNHEYHQAGARPYWDHFGSRAGTRGKGWYAYDLGAWRVYSLNANCDRVACGATGEQVRWLVADLAANPRACVAAVWHQPLFSSGSEHGNDPAVKPLWQALQAAGADVVLNGHDHDYERFDPQTADGVASATGIREFVVGTGGGSLRGWGTIRANSAARISGVHGILKLTLHAGSYDWRFLPTTGTSADSGSGACH